MLTSTVPTQQATKAPASGPGAVDGPHKNLKSSASSGLVLACGLQPVCVRGACLPQQLALPYYSPFLETRETPFMLSRSGCRAFAAATQSSSNVLRRLCSAFNRQQALARLCLGPQGATRLMSATTTWTGAGTQQDFMLKDECLVVDERDNITGHSNKYTCHQFLKDQPTGILHRAFSVFLFNREGKLLLQQRAKSKVTFPSVWTNTCCSHPLFGQHPDEVDQPHHVADGSVPGVKNAAVRKLLHELGIQPHQLPLERFKFLTRLHYCAADTDAWGPNAEWGEHEMDYILFIKTDVDVHPNADEVDTFKYVTHEELRAMMLPDSGLKWSPWFRIIADRFLEKWWRDLDETLSTDKHCDFGTIHKV